MQTRGTITNIGISFPSRKAVVTFEITAPPEQVESYQNMDLDISFDKHREKRSLSANAYFWKLVNLIADSAKVSDTMVHDRLLSENVAYVYRDDGAFDWKVSPEHPNCYGLICDGRESYYIDSGMKVRMQRPDGRLLQKKGEAVEGRIYWHIKGSHQMDTKEMSRLIDSAVYEAKELGIEVMSPAQIKLLIDMWGERIKQEKADELNNSAFEQQELPL